MPATEPALVSIIVPCFNAAAWLAQTLDSAMAQTWPNVEVILIDDGSTDGSLAIAERYADRLRILRRTHSGASAARNAGLAVARGRYVQFLDADDVLAPRKIAEQVRLLEHTTDTVATCRWARFRRDVNQARPSSSPLYQNLDAREFLLLQGHTGAKIIPHSWLIPKSLADRVGPWNESLTMDDDGEYFTRVVVAAQRVLHCPQILAFYRSFHTRSLSRRRGRAHFDSALRAVDLTVEQLLLLDNSTDMRRGCANHYQRCLYLIYPNCPDLLQYASRRVAELGGSEVAPDLAPKTAFLARLVGWKLVFKIRNFLWRWDIYLSKHRMISD